MVSGRLLVGNRLGGSGSRREELALNPPAMEAFTARNASAVVVLGRSAAACSRVVVIGSLSFCCRKKG